MIICNISTIPQMVKLDMEDGATAEIRVMPKARPELPPGATVNQRWLAMNPRCIHVFPEQKKQPVYTVPTTTDEEE